MGTFTRVPGKFADRANGNVAIDHYPRYPEDVGLIAEIGLHAYHFSTAWSRILPDGVGTVNQKGLDFYDRLVDTLLAKNIEPYVCLYHYDFPFALHQKGGWTKRETASYFAEYASIVAKLLSDRVRTFLTHNEPWVAATSGYLLGKHGPRQMNPMAMFKSFHHMMLSHGLAMDAICVATWQPVKIGIILNLIPIYPFSNHPKDSAIAKAADVLVNRAQLDPLLKSTSPLQEFALGRALSRPFIKPGDLETIHRLDLLGVNYYSRAVVQHHPWLPFIDRELEKLENGEYSMMWEVYPQGIYDLLTGIWKDYRPTCEVLITENGIPLLDTVDADGCVHDERRIHFIQDHLRQIHLAMQSDIPVKGYFHWSFADNFEWALGNTPRFGLVYVDYNTLLRTTRKAGSGSNKLFGRMGFHFRKSNQIGKLTGSSRAAALSSPPGCGY